MTAKTRVLDSKFHASRDHAFIDCEATDLPDADLSAGQLGVYAEGKQPVMRFKDSASVIRDVNLPQTANVTILAAAVATLSATPVSLIAAPGAGLYIDVHRAHWMLKHNGVDYDAAGADEDLAMSYTDASGDLVVNSVDHLGFGNASADAHAVVFGIDCVPVANAAIVAHLLSGEWYGAAGDGDLHVQIDYTIRSLDLSA